jgi:hypothetical protein
MFGCTALDIILANQISQDMAMAIPATQVSPNLDFLIPANSTGRAIGLTVMMWRGD